MNQQEKEEHNRRIEAEVLRIITTPQPAPERIVYVRIAEMASDRIKIEPLRSEDDWLLGWWKLEGVAAQIVAQDLSYMQCFPATVLPLLGERED